MKIPFLKNLLNRRVPHIIGVYSGGSVAALGFVDLLINRYALSPHLITFCLVLLVSLIPTVLLMAYFHGKPGRDKWTKVEKIGIPTNLLFVVVLLILIFHGKGLGAMTKTVTVMDEEGKQIERVVLKQEFHKSLVLFNFENKSGDSESDWLQYGLSILLDLDLSQDLFLETKGMLDSSNEFYRRVKDAGYSEAVGLPLALERKIATEYHMRYFLTGDFTKSNNQWTVNTSLYETERVKLIAERTITRDNIFKLVDAMTVQLKHDLEIPKRHIKETADLPISEIMTKSIDAAKMVILGVKAGLFQNDLEAAKQYLEQAIQEDPTVVIAHFGLGVFYARSNQGEKAIKALEKALQYDYKRPGGFEFIVKDVLFQITGEWEKQFKLLKMRAELYPDSIYAHERLASVYRERTTG